MITVMSGGPRALWEIGVQLEGHLVDNPLSLGAKVHPPVSQWRDQRHPPRLEPRALTFGGAKTVPDEHSIAGAQAFNTVRNAA